MSKPAFPIQTAMDYNFGMSLRDYFAAHAMTALIAQNIPPPLVASLAYEIADEMVKRGANEKPH